MDTTLVIMAAGIGSRFGGGVKQLERIGPNGEIIMDYAIRDALRAGFGKVVFIIRRDLERDFRQAVGDRAGKLCKVAYAFQELDDLPEGFARPRDRVKPWGTGQAVLACRGLIDEPFLVINADDYYGKTSYAQVRAFLTDPVTEDGTMRFCLPGFILKNTLSENGGVTRGICRVDSRSFLLGVDETHNIVRTEAGAAIAEPDGTLRPLDPDSYVSMNMWGLTPAFFPVLEEGFSHFLSSLAPGDLKSEYLLPTIIDGLVRDGRARVKLLHTSDRWMGITYREDKEIVAGFFRRQALEERLPKAPQPE